MRPGVVRRTKPSSEAEKQFKADVALAGRRAELLDAAREAESQFRQAQARQAPDAEMRRLAEDLDAALTEAMRAAWAAQRAEIGPRGYDDRIYRRKARATPRVHALTAEAEHLLTLRETHRLTGIPAVPFEPAS
jgi:hypothetical protein